MKITLLIFILILFSGCENMGSYTFIVKNSTDKTVMLFFSNPSESRVRIDSTRINSKTVTLSPNEEKIVRIISAPFNSSAHDCLYEHGIHYFSELIFDIYADEKKIEKQIWQSQNWTYHKTGKWHADYKMTLTNELLGI